MTPGTPPVRLTPGSTLTLPAGTWRDRAGEVGRHDLACTVDFVGPGDGRPFADDDRYDLWIGVALRPVSPTATHRPWIYVPRSLVEKERG